MVCVEDGGASLKGRGNNAPESHDIKSRSGDGVEYAADRAEEGVFGFTGTDVGIDGCYEKED